MQLDIIIVSSYFIIIFLLAIRGRINKQSTIDEYFLSSRNLRWPSIAISTIATNIQGYQFIGMMGSAYLYGLAQANLEINAVQGILLAAFVFVPLYLKDRIITISQFIKNKLGPNVAILYAVANLILFSTIGLGAALFWGAYAANMVFGDYLVFINEDPLIRTAILIAALGIFSAIYTYMGGLKAVVRTDIFQFSILIFGGLAVLWVVMVENGGWSALYEKTPELMHLHLPAEHEKLPWTLLFGLFFLNINYWCANQAVMQRSLAAESLEQAQKGLLVGGVLKYFMAVLIVVPGIALFGVLGEQGLNDPDQAFPYIVSNFVPTGLRGLILCALFASLMSTIDSTFNSLATIYSIDIYREYLNPEASEMEVISAGRKTILVTLFTGVCMGIALLYLKYTAPGSSFTHTLNELRYFINCGIVIIILSASLFILKNSSIVLFAFLLTIPMNIGLKIIYPEMNYFVRAGWVIFSNFLLLGIFAFWKKSWKHPKFWFQSASSALSMYGWLLLISLVIIHLIFS